MKFLFVCVAILASLYARGSNDAHHLDRLIGHLENGLSLGELVQDKAQGPEIKRMSRIIMREERRWMKQLQRWRENYQKEEEEFILPEKYVELESSRGRNFDIKFLHVLKEHHQRGIELLTQVIEKTSRESLKEFALDAREKLAEELKQIVEMKKRWGE